MFLKKNKGFSQNRNSLNNMKRKPLNESCVANLKKTIETREKSASQIDFVSLWICETYFLEGRHHPYFVFVRHRTWYYSTTVL
jgi:hypothetical protein